MDQMTYLPTAGDPHRAREMGEVEARRRVYPRVPVRRLLTGIMNHVFFRATHVSPDIPFSLGFPNKSKTSPASNRADPQHEKWMILCLGKMVSLSLLLAQSLKQH